MNTDDPIFTDLALKVIAGNATTAELAQLQALLAQPELAEEFKQLKADAAFAKEVLPLMGEAPATTPALTDFEISQLKRTAEARALKAEVGASKPFWSWRWVWGLAAATAVIAIVVMLNLPAQKATVQFAMLDSMGQMRGTNDVTAQLVTALQEHFGQTNFAACSGNQELTKWLNQWPAGRSFKLVYDRDNGEVRILSRVKDVAQVVKTFPVARESDLSSVLKAASEAIQQLQKETP